MVDAARSVATPLALMYAVVTVSMSSLEMLEDVQVENVLQSTIIGTSIHLTFNTDVNECVSGSHNCSGLAECVNEVGFFRCSCPDGYRLDDSQASCIGK